MPARWLVLACMVLACMVLLPGCRESPRAAQTAGLQVAVSLPLYRNFENQPTAIQAYQRLQALELALEQARHRAGGVAVRLKVTDVGRPRADEEIVAEQDCARQAIADPSVVAYLGPLTSEQSRASLPLLNRHAITQIGLSTTWPGLTKPGFGAGEPGIHYPTGRRHFFRLVPADDVQAVAAAQWAWQLGARTVFVVDDETAYGRGASGIFALRGQDLGMRVLDHAGLDSLAPSAEALALAARVIAAQPDLLYYAGGVTDPALAMLVQVRRESPDLSIMLPDSAFELSLSEELGAGVAEGIYATSVSVPVSELGTPAAAAFIAAYRQRYGEEPSLGAAIAYEAMKVLLHAIASTRQPTRETVLAAMEQLGEFSGVFGRWHFDPHGDISQARIGSFRMHSGQWLFASALDGSQPATR